MKNLLVLSILLVTVVVSVSAGNDYLWGEIGSRDTLISKKIVSKAFVVGLVVKEKYVFKQDNLNAYTITAVKVTDKKKKDGATAELISGGPGSKGATIRFTSQRGHGIKDEVEIWGR
ncbi:probable salivary secreted peptide [Calliphora vicina]|uniref:probable salivary secreted peptide n=1 Tax=Calliphora vicina TaxID=7373 RepID=UPI00325A85E1